MSVAREVTVRIREMTKSYGTNVAVADLSLALYAGEVFAFLGLNGAGKTTTLKATTGLLRPDRGSVEVCGYDLGRTPEAAKHHIAYVPDQPFIYDKLTGREFIRFTWEMYGVPVDEAEERLTELRRQFTLDGFIDSLCETYSHGMKQKVALVAALIHAPRVLIVDEPMVGLDPRTARTTRDLFRALADRGGTVFMSTHTLDVAEQSADRIGIIHHGRLLALGTLSELRYQSQMDGRLEDIFLRLTDETTDEARPNGDPAHGSPA
ncbi:MAG: ABC transporter ATP-binding protein [Phycisphaerales bacterium]|nr:ABC transporter ATP-binding protein [Phycisphaerales bacterium]